MFKIKRKKKFNYNYSQTTKIFRFCKYVWIIANTLESSGLIVGIKKESDGNKRQNATNLQFLINRMATNKKAWNSYWF